MHPQRTGFMICNHYFSSKSVCGNISLKPLYTNTSGVACSNYYDSSSFLIPWSYTVTMIVTCPKCWSDKLTSCGYVCNTTVVKKKQQSDFYLVSQVYYGLQTNYDKKKMTCKLHSVADFVHFQVNIESVRKRQISHYGNMWQTKKRKKYLQRERVKEKFYFLITQFELYQFIDGTIIQ